MYDADTMDSLADSLTAFLRRNHLLRRMALPLLFTAVAAATAALIM